MDKLIAERKTLTDTLASCDSGAYPGSKASMREYAAIKALAAFDKDHPEVHAEILRRSAVAVAARTIPAGGR